MWICRECDTKNQDTDFYCACCGAKNPNPAAPEAPRPVGNNQSGSVSRPAASQDTSRAQGASRTSVTPAGKRVLSHEEKRLIELRSAVKIPEKPSTRLDKNPGYWFSQILTCMCLSTWAGALLTYLPVWIFGNLVEKLGGTPLLTSETAAPYIALWIPLCFVLYWVMIIVKRKRAAEFRVMWKDGEITARWHPVKKMNNLAVGLDGEWIALYPCVLNGSWIMQEGMAVGLRCACDHRPKKAVLGKVGTESDTLKFSGASFISVADVQ